MSFVIKQIRENELPDTVIPNFVNWEHHKLYTLVNEEGHLAKNDNGNAIIYICSLPDTDIAPFEAYSFLHYWAEEEVKFKKLSALDIMFSDLSMANSIHEDFENLPSFEYENYEYEFHNNMNPKSLQKLRRSLVDLHKNIQIFESICIKYIDYLQNVMNQSSNVSIGLLSNLDILINKIETYIPIENILPEEQLSKLEEIRNEIQTVPDLTEESYINTRKLYSNLPPVRILRNAVYELQDTVRQINKNMNKFARHLEDLFDEREYQYDPEYPRLNQPELYGFSEEFYQTNDEIPFP